VLAAPAAALAAGRRLPATVHAPPEPSSAHVEQLAEWVAAAQFPLVLTSNLGRHLEAVGALDALARRFPKGAHQPVVLGVTARAAGLGPEDAAYCAAYESVGGPASATVRLLGLDPFDATGVLARLAPEVDAVAARAAGAARRVAREGADALPAASAPLLETGAEAHAGWAVRLFAT